MTEGADGRGGGGAERARFGDGGRGEEYSFDGGSAVAVADCIVQEMGESDVNNVER